MTYHLYITNKNYSSWSLRPWLLLRELNIPFVEELRPLASGSFRQPRTYTYLPTDLPPYLPPSPHKPPLTPFPKPKQNGVNSPPSPPSPACTSSRTPTPQAKTRKP